ncbi:MAG: hypothetical protein U1F76_28150 [Candidatus Competibacteraceae bacterium]
MLVAWHCGYRRRPCPRRRPGAYLDWAAVAVPLVETLRQTRALELPPDADLLARRLQVQGLVEPGPRPGWLRLLDPAVFPGEASG